MEKNDIKQPLLLAYPSQTGVFHYFSVDWDVAEEFGITEVMKSLGSAMSDFNSCVQSGWEIASARTKGRTKHEKRFQKRLMKFHAKGMPELRKARGHMKKAIKTFHESGKKKKDKREAEPDEIRQRLLELELTTEERKILQEEYDKAKAILETEGREEYLKHLLENLDSMEEGLADVENAFVPASIVWFCIIMLIILAICFVGTAILVTDIALRHHYIVNKNTKEVHDAFRLTFSCNINLIRDPLYMNELDDALVYINEKGYNGCAWCFPEYDTG